MRLIGSTLVVPVALPLWCLLVLGGAAVLGRPGATPVEPASPPAAWPADAPPLWRRGQPLVLLLLDPRCPGPGVTAMDLARLLARAPVAPAVHVLVQLPPGPPRGLPEGWAQSPSFRAAARLPGVTLHLDAGGAAARRLGLRTAGQILLYDQDGRLRLQQDGRLRLQGGVDAR